MLAWLRARLGEQGTHTGIALASLIVVVAHGVGVDLTVWSEGATAILANLATIAGIVAALVKAVRPDTGASADSAVAAVNVAAETARHLRDLLREADARLPGEPTDLVR